MYWQVYLHKTVVAAEKMLIMIIRRAKALIAAGVETVAATPAFNRFLQGSYSDGAIELLLEDFCQMDDHDIMATVKNWCSHEDTILSLLCKAIIQRIVVHVQAQKPV